MKYSVFSASTPTKTLEELAPQISALGYNGWELRVVDEPPNSKGMEFWHGNKSTVPATDFDKHVDRIKKLQEDNNLELVNLGTYVRSDDEWSAIEQAVASAVAIGAPTLRINVPQYDGTESYQKIWDKAREDYKRVEELVAKHNVKALVETHHGTICPSASSARRFVEGLDPRHVGVIHDIGNMVIEGHEHPRMGFEVLGEYLSLVHVKNATLYPRKYREDRSMEWSFKFWPLHQGRTDIRVWVRALIDVGYDGWISFEDFNTQQKQDERLQAGLEYIKRLIAEETDASSE